MLQPAQVSHETEHAQRVQVEREPGPAGERVRITVESYDPGLGWYTSGSLILPLHQLPLLEQATEAMRRSARHQEYAEIIPFPTGEAERSV